MKEHHLRALLHSAEILDNRLAEHLRKGALLRTEADETKTAGHADKADHNLKFTEDTLKQGYTDWKRYTGGSRMPGWTGEVLRSL